MRGIALADNVNGTDLLPLLCERAATAGISLFFLGGRPGVAARAAAALRNRVRGLRFAGVQHGYYAEEDEDGIIERINVSGADLLVVAFGAPHQELWIARHAARLRPAIRVGVGGAFDFHSGRIARAPLWMREVGIEWVWRLMQEPRRMWRRYVLGNPLFVWRAWRDARRATRRTRRIRAGTPAGRYANPAALRRRHRLRASVERVTWLALVRGLDAAKRMFDALAAAALLVALSPVFAATAVAIRLDSPGPVFFGQTRVGRHGTTFRMWKFRSMHVDAEARRRELEARNEMAGGVLFKMRDDPRITRVGRLIRKASIDELPQLWNVLRGDMSLVGPRPPIPSEVARYRIGDRRRLEAKPGITCLWQVSGRSAIPFPQQVRLDVEYIETMSIRRDLAILLRTIPAVLGARGAY